MFDIPNGFERINYNLDKKEFIPTTFGTIVLPTIDADEIYENNIDSSIYELMRGQVVTASYKEVNCENNSECALEYCYLIQNSQRVFSFFFLNCQNDAVALFLIHATCATKVWINYQLYSIVSGGNKMLVINLKSGINAIVLESPNAEVWDRIFLRISNYIYEKKKVTLPCMFDGDMLYHERFGFTINSGTHLYEGQPFKFIFFPNHDILGKKDTLQFFLFDNYIKEPILQKELKIKQKCIINLPTCAFNDYNDGHYLVAEIRYLYNNQYEYKERFALFTQDVEPMLEKTIEKAENTVILAKHEYDKLCLNFGIAFVRDTSRKLSSRLDQAALLRSNIKHIQNGNRRDGMLYEKGVKRVFFFNPMYNIVNYYRVYVPENYNSEKKYPLIIIYSTYEYNSWCNVFSNYKKEPVIAVDISSRGILLGSYIGEAAINMALKDVLSRFNIDKNRIYGTGYSNGGGAVWAQAEAFPDLFAGILAVSGEACYDLLCNLKNMRIIHLSSKEDIMYDSYKKISSYLAEHLDHFSILGNKFSHNTIQRIWYNQRLFDKLLSSRKVAFPDKVIYKTFRNRHRKAYWIEIHSILDGCVEGTVDAHICSNEKISISCAGITGFSITVPPQINKNQFKILVNEQNEFIFENKECGCIHFSKQPGCNSNCFKTIDTYIPIVDLHKGNGLLDVYLDPLSIVVPPKASRSINEVAIAYSEPHCNGFIPKVYIKYPIIDYDNVCHAIDFTERSYVVIDDGSNHPFLCEIRKKAKVICNSLGWIYKDKEYKGSCCVQQIVNSPWNQCRNIHLISYNDTTMLKKNLFTKKLIIPTYANGRHEFLNNDALIFDAAGYHKILDYGSDPVNISSELVL